MKRAGNYVSLWGVESSNPNKGRPNLTQRCKRFATASTST